jgi:hypothetical protein
MPEKTYIVADRGMPADVPMIRNATKEWYVGDTVTATDLGKNLEWMLEDGVIEEAQA